jgi:hypothetical protein
VIKFILSEESRGLLSVSKQADAEPVVKINDVLVVDFSQSSNVSMQSLGPFTSFFKGEVIMTSNREIRMVPTESDDITGDALWLLPRPSKPIVYFYFGERSEMELFIRENRDIYRDGPNLIRSYNFKSEEQE